MAASPSTHLILSEPAGVHQCQGRLQQFQLHILLMELFHLQASRQGGCASGKHLGEVDGKQSATQLTLHTASNQRRKLPALPAIRSESYLLAAANNQTGELAIISCQLL